MGDITIYHNPRCSNSRNALALIRDNGVEPTIIEYLEQPPGRALLRELAQATGLGVRGLIRSKEPRYAALGLDDPARSDEDLIDAMLAHPVLINRPIVVTPLGARLCRPPEVVLGILPRPRHDAPPAGG